MRLGTCSDCHQREAKQTGSKDHRGNSVNGGLKAHDAQDSYDLATGAANAGGSNVPHSGESGQAVADQP